MHAVKRIWAVWKALAHRLGRVQTMILLSLIYHTGIAGVWLVSRVKGEDPLGLRRPDVTLPETTSTLERAHKQF